MKRLSDTEFRATFAPRMELLDSAAKPPFDFRPYFDAIGPDEIAGYDFTAGRVDRVYRDGTGRYEHVLIRCEDVNVFLILVLELRTASVLGHHLLDLSVEYGTKE